MEEQKTPLTPNSSPLTDNCLSDAINFAERELGVLTADEKINYNLIKKSAQDAYKYFIAALFPSHVNFYSKSIKENLELACENLIYAINIILQDKNKRNKSEDFTVNLLKKLPEIRKNLLTDIAAAYQGDPAAKNSDEIILAYPAFTAISAYRIAHELHNMNVPLIPRIITEYAHSLTGIDIHPGAKIGEYFFIDHGTGVVIGETSTIGHHVKIYQNVTIGAKSFAVLPDGSLVKGIKRHPDIGNNVIIYAGATILGGDTIIGDNSVIGGNTWITKSVSQNEIVLRDKE